MIFNSSIDKAEKNGLKTAWSNESIELWFLLHFENIQSPILRTEYIKKLDRYLKEKTGKGYSKNQENIYNFLETYGNYRSAVKRAKKLEEFNVGKTPSSSNPQTMVFKLIEELKEMLE